MSVIAFDNVSKRFTLRQDKRRPSMLERLTSLVRPRSGGEDFWVLRDISFAVERGESIGLIGNNGAGKSTALKLMTRILEPSTGSVHLQGRVAALLELGSGFHPDLSGRENVFLYGSLMGFNRRDMQKRLDAIVDFAEIGQFFDTEVKHYSSGMYTRLAFAVATEVEPDILITDEVLAVGDETFQRRCMERIYRFRRMGKTIVFVSHALEVVRTLCDTAIWLDGGRARATGPASQVIDDYLDDVNRRERERLVRLRYDNTQPAAAEEQQEEEAVRRRGSREVEIVQVELLDPEGHPRNVFYTHEPLRVRLHYVAHQPVAWPVFGVGLHHENGFWLTGPNTAFDGFEIPRVDGAGFVDYVIPSLPLLSGRYDLTVAIYDETMLHPYDVHDRLYQVPVQSRGIGEKYGVLSLAGRWQWSEQQAPTAAETRPAPAGDVALRSSE